MRKEMMALILSLTALSAQAWGQSEVEFNLTGHYGSWESRHGRPTPNRWYTIEVTTQGDDVTMSGVRYNAETKSESYVAQFSKTGTNQYSLVTGQVTIDVTYPVTGRNGRVQLITGTCAYTISPPAHGTQAFTLNFSRRENRNILTVGGFTRLFNDQYRAECNNSAAHPVLSTNELSFQFADSPPEPVDPRTPNIAQYIRNARSLGLSFDNIKIVQRSRQNSWDNSWENYDVIVIDNPHLGGNPLYVYSYRNPRGEVASSRNTSFFTMPYRDAPNGSMSDSYICDLITLGRHHPQNQSQSYQFEIADAAWERVTDRSERRELPPFYSSRGNTPVRALLPPVESGAQVPQIACVRPGPRQLVIDTYNHGNIQY